MTRGAKIDNQTEPRTPHLQRQTDFAPEQAFARKGRTGVMFRGTERER
jgi:hypothetical protein